MVKVANTSTRYVFLKPGSIWRTGSGSAVSNLDGRDVSGGPLADGWLNGDEVECPWHGSRFCVKTGEVVKQPATEPVARYSVRIEGDDVYVGPAE